jgi:hypothetical protein
MVQAFNDDISVYSLPPPPSLSSTEFKFRKK